MKQDVCAYHFSREMHALLLGSLYDLFVARMHEEFEWKSCSQPSNNVDVAL